MKRYLSVLALASLGLTLPFTQTAADDQIRCDARELPQKSCFAEAEHHEFRAEILRARALYQELCAAKNGDACLRLARIFRDRGEPEKMREFYKKGCEAGQSAACASVELVTAALAKIAARTEKDAKKCIQSKHTRQACYDAGTLFRDTGDLAQAIHNFVPGCQSGGAKSCLALAEMARASESPVEAKLRFQKACDLRIKTACEMKKLIP